VNFCTPHSSSLVFDVRCNIIILFLPPVSVESLQVTKDAHSIVSSKDLCYKEVIMSMVMAQEASVRSLVVSSLLFPLISHSKTFPLSQVPMEICSPTKTSH
jgi:hypothetical protein